MPEIFSFSPYEDDPEYDPRAPQKSVKRSNAPVPQVAMSAKEQDLYETLVGEGVGFTSEQAQTIVLRWRLLYGAVNRSY